MEVACIRTRVKLDISTKNNMGGNLQSFAFHTAQEAWRQNLLVQKRMPLSNVTPMFHWPVPSPEEILLISHVVTNRQSIKNKRPNKLEKSLTINNFLLIFWFQARIVTWSNWKFTTFREVWFFFIAMLRILTTSDLTRCFKYLFNQSCAAITEITHDDSS